MGFKPRPRLKVNRTKRTKLTDAELRDIELLRQRNDVLSEWLGAWHDWALSELRRMGRYLDALPDDGKAREELSEALRASERVICEHCGQDGGVPGKTLHNCTGGGESIKVTPEEHRRIMTRYVMDELEREIGTDHYVDIYPPGVEDPGNNPTDVWRVELIASDGSSYGAHQGDTLYEAFQSALDSDRP